MDEQDSQTHQHHKHHHKHRHSESDEGKQDGTSQDKTAEQTTEPVEQPKDISVDIVVVNDHKKHKHKHVKVEKEEKEPTKEQVQVDVSETPTKPPKEKHSEKAQDQMKVSKKKKTGKKQTTPEIPEERAASSTAPGITVGSLSVRMLTEAMFRFIAGTCGAQLDEYVQACKHTHNDNSELPAEDIKQDSKLDQPKPKRPTSGVFNKEVRHAKKLTFLTIQGFVY